MISNAWNIEDVELEEPRIFWELAAELDDFHILDAPKVGFDD